MDVTVDVDTPTQLSRVDRCVTQPRSNELMPLVHEETIDLLEYQGILISRQGIVVASNEELTAPQESDLGKTLFCKSSVAQHPNFIVLLLDGILPQIGDVLLVLLHRIKLIAELGDLSMPKMQIADHV
jgi:hypothetical protein